MRDNVSDRKGVLRRSQIAYERFLHLLDTYIMLSKSDKKLLERFLETRDEFSLLASNDASTRRDTKIKRYKQESELKLKLEVRTQLLPISEFSLTICSSWGRSPMLFKETTQL